jgi:hypothetical protein
VTKAWAKREAQVTAMVDSTVGMVGDLYDIMGRAMPEISAFDDPIIEGKAASGLIGLIPIWEFTHEFAID